MFGTAVGKCFLFCKWGGKGGGGIEGGEQIRFLAQEVWGARGLRDFGALRRKGNHFVSSWRTGLIFCNIFYGGDRDLATTEKCCWEEQKNTHRTVCHNTVVVGGGNTTRFIPSKQNMWWKNKTACDYGHQRLGPPLGSDYKPKSKHRIEEANALMVCLCKALSSNVEAAHTHSRKRAERFGLSLNNTLGIFFFRFCREV